MFLFIKKMNRRVISWEKIFVIRIIFVKDRLLVYIKIFCKLVVKETSKLRKNV